MSPDSSWKIVAEVSEYFKSSEDFGLATYERMVYRHGATLSLCEGAADLTLGRRRHWRWIQVECGREEMNDGEKQEKDKHEETDNERSSTHHG